jgi:hypothetical protein
VIFYTHERNFGCRLTEFVYCGLPTVTLENELLRVTILAGKGGDIFEFLYKPLDVDFMWRSPWGVRDPAPFVATSHTPVSAFLDFYEGGWQDCLPTGGNPCDYQGQPFGAHGEAATIPWRYSIVEDSPECVALKLWVRTYRTPFLVEKTLTLERGRAVLRIAEQITNEGRVTLPIMWGQHPAFGPPFVDESCRIDLPGGRVHATQLTPNTRFVAGEHAWPLVPGRDGNLIDLRRVAGCEADTSDTLRIADLAEGWYALTNTQRQVGFGMAWPLAVFPALWFWQVYGGAYGAPWYGRTYNVALEPFSTVQTTIVDAQADGSAHSLAPGETWAAQFVAVAYSGLARVAGITADGSVLA